MNDDAIYAGTIEMLLGCCCKCCGCTVGALAVYADAACVDDE